MNEELKPSPIAIALAAAFVRSSDKKRVTIPPAALAKARSQLLATDDPDVVVHLIALCVRTRRIGGKGALPAVRAIATLVADKLGSQAKAAQLLETAGLPMAETRPPPSKTPVAAKGKPKRGLR